MKRYTIKDWFYNHPNVTFVLLGAWFVWLVVVVTLFFSEERWGWAAVALVGSVAACLDAQRWWRDHL